MNIYITTAADTTAALQSTMAQSRSFAIQLEQVTSVL